MRGDIYLYDPPNFGGHVQRGLRPAVLIADANNIVTLIPLTSQLNAFRYSHTCILKPDADNNLTQESVALIFQIIAIGRDCLRQKIGIVNRNDMKTIDALMKNYLKL